MENEEYIPFMGLHEHALHFCANEIIKQPARDYLGASYIGDNCDRKIWLKWKNLRIATDLINKNDISRLGKFYQILERGKEEEERLIFILEGAGYKVSDRQKNISYLNGQFKGHIDGIIKDEQETAYLLEIKSASQKNYNQLIKKTIQDYSATYYAQIQMYMHFLDLEKCLFLIVNKNSGGGKDDLIFHQRVISKDKPIVDGLLLKIKRILMYEREMPGRLGDENHMPFFCKFCEYFSFCYGGGEENEKSTCV